MYCKKCGKELNDGDRFCSFCGFDNESKVEVNTTYAASNYDTGSFGWAVLGFFIPICGLILYLVWKDEKPLSAKMAGKGALVSVIINVIFWIIYIICIAAGVLSFAGAY